MQEAELRRVEEEKERALRLQRKERELREKLLSNLMSKKIEVTHLKRIELNSAPLKAIGGVSHGVTSTSAQSTVARPVQCYQSSISPNESIGPQAKYLNGSFQEVVHINEPKTIINNRNTVSEESSSGVLSCIPVNQQYRSTSENEQKTFKKDLTEQDKCNREPSKGKSHSYRDAHNHHSKEKTERNRHRRDLSSEDEKYKKDRHHHKKYAAKSSSPSQRSLSRERVRERRSFSRGREQDKRGCSHGHKSTSKKQKHQKRSLSNQRNSWSR